MMSVVEEVRARRVERLAGSLLARQRPDNPNDAMKQLLGNLGPYDDGRSLKSAVDRYFRERVN